MDVLKKIFNETVSVDLPEGHFERFSEKLGKKLHKQRGSVYVYIGYAAAVIVLIFILSIAINRKNNERIHSNYTILTMEDKEMVETEQYFQNEIDRRIAAIEKMNDSQKKILLKDIKEFDSSFKTLQYDYKQTPGDDRIVNAILTTYMMKIEALDKIMNILQKHS